MTMTWVQEKERHHEHCETLMSELTVLRLKYRREAGYRADLIYQKHYVIMLLDDHGVTYVASVGWGVDFIDTIVVIVWVITTRWFLQNCVVRHV